ncbi:MAG: hypothetical protein VB078_08990 [Clostridiaceae bacterium]|nr:hypothetical protein [Clostridiaceae bacterium]
MKIHVCLLTMLLCLSMLISACGINESATAGTSPAVSPVGISPSSSESNGPKIVFHDTIDDPQGEYLNALGGGSETSGTTGLDLILYETQPNVFEGCGVMSRSVDIAQGEAGGSAQKYVYRTGLVRAEAGKEGSVTLTGWLTDDSNIPAMIPEAPFDVVIHKDATLRQEGLPLLLTLNGNQASLCIKLHDHAEFVFSGEMTTESVEPPVGRPSDPESLIYVNSMWSCVFSGGADGGEYTAVLLASPNAGTYSGQLSIQGTGNALGAINEAVTFSFEPFDATAYREAGGQMDDQFASMSVLHTAAGDYILLLDGERVFLEPAGKEIYFFGSMPSASLLDSLQNETAKTREMLSSLYRQKSGTEASMPDYSGLKDLDPNKPEDMQKLMDASKKMNAMISHQNAPAWYPKGLIPMANFSADDGFNTIPSATELLFKIYNAEYCESEDFEDLIQPYRSVLSGYDNYHEYLNHDDSEGVFLFTMGQYTVQVYIMQPVLKLTNVSVQIY